MLQNNIVGDVGIFRFNKSYLQFIVLFICVLFTAMLLPLYYQVPVFHVTLIPKILVKKGLYLPANSGVSNFSGFYTPGFPPFTLNIPDF